MTVRGPVNAGLRQRPVSSMEEVYELLNRELVPATALMRDFVNGQFRKGAGSPEGVEVANVGTLFFRTDGGAGTSVYRKESGTGATGWVGASEGTPGPAGPAGPAGSTGPTGPAGTLGSAQYHDTTGDPILLLQGDEPVGTAVDSSGNGFDLEVAAGSSGRAMLAPGLQGYWFQGTNFYRMPGGSTSDGNNALRLTGSMGVMWIGAYPYLTGTHTGRPLISFGAAGETEATNALYTMVNVSSVDDSMHDFWEQGAGVNVTPISDYSISMGNAPTHYAAVRSVSGGVATLSYYVDGRLFFSTTGWTAPTGGDDGVFKFGADHIEGNKNIGYAASVAVFDYAPDLAQVEAAYNLTLGPVKGTI